MPDKLKIKKKSIARRVNPRITDVEIGIRNLRNIKVYPLSMNDQTELTALIGDIVKSIFSTDTSKLEEKETNLIYIANATKAIEENIDTILKYVVPDEDTTKLKKELDNQQLSDIVRVVYQTNYEKPVKNVMSLFPKEQLESVLKRQPLPSVNDMDIGLNTSLDSLSKKEA